MVSIGMLVVLSMDVISQNCFGEEAPPIFKLKWGTQGSGDGQFLNPEGLAVDKNAKVYVADQGNFRIQKFSSDGTFITKWGSFCNLGPRTSPAEGFGEGCNTNAPGGQSSGDGQFAGLVGIAVGPDGSIYTTEMFNERVQKFTPDGTFITKWSPATAVGFSQFFARGIGVDSSGNVYVSDFNSQTIAKFSSGGSFIKSWNIIPTAEGKAQVNDIAVDAAGNVYVAITRGSQPIEIFNSEGTFIRKFGSFLLPNGQFSDVAAIGVDTFGNIYVADGDNASFNRLQKFTNDGTLLTTWGSFGTGDSQFLSPSGIAIDLSRNIYVSDVAAHRIQVFSQAVITPSGNVLPLTATPPGLDIHPPVVPPGRDPGFIPPGQTNINKK